MKKIHKTTVSVERSLKIPYDFLIRNKIQPGEEVGMVEYMGGLLLLPLDCCNEDYLIAMHVAEQVMRENKEVFAQLAES